MSLSPYYVLNVKQTSLTAAQLCDYEMTFSLLNMNKTSDFLKLNFWRIHLICFRFHFCYE